MYSKDKTVTFDSDTIKVFNKLLNRELKKRYEWFEKIEIDELTYNSNHSGAPFMYIGISGDIFVDEDWVGNQWMKYNYSRPLTKDELSFGDIIGKEESKEIQDIIFLIFSAITARTPKYLSFSWINVNPIEKKLQENIIRIKEIMS
jgi:hypothetical protein